MKRSPNHQAWVDVAVFESLESGRMLEAFFKDNGFDARTYDDKLFRCFLFLRPPPVTWRVQVRKNHFEEATQLVVAKSPVVLERAIHCPSCGSLRVNYPQMTRKFILPTVLLHLGIIFRIIEHQCYCESCHEMWNLPKGASAVSKGHAAKPIAF